MNELRALLGKGMRFPFVNNDRNGVETSDLIDRINQSLLILFDTPKGDRLMLPDFGSDIHKYKFEPNDSILYDRLRECILEDVRRWEPRIRINDIKFHIDPSIIDNNKLYISISYTIINTETKGNFVYPYMKETYDSIATEV